MSCTSPFTRRTLLAAVYMASSLAVGANAYAGGTPGSSNFGGARIGGTGGYSGAYSGLPRGSSVISHGGTGFSIYSQQGVTRVIGVPGVSRRILLPQGGSTQVIGDGTGGARLFGAGGYHQIIGNHPLNVDDGP